MVNEKKICYLNSKMKGLEQTLNNLNNDSQNTKTPD
jgi:hypothetical protein